MISLPVDAIVPEVARIVASTDVQHRALVLQASPGSGKTTRVPAALLNVVKGDILVLEPRRLAARLSAERVASELGQACGELVGYQVRGDSKLSKNTRLKFITEGLLVRYLLEDPTLSRVSCVILDEFHERHLQSDVALSILDRLLRNTRANLKVIVMSATIDTSKLIAFLGKDTSTLLQLEAPRFPVEVIYRPARDPMNLATTLPENVRAAVDVCRGRGHILVFLPGYADIKACGAVLEQALDKKDFLVLELRADTPAAVQRQAFEPNVRTKVILATNVAETSITIDGIGAVIDCGLAKVPGFAPWSGLDTLSLKRVSKASCIQRAGRAGRTGPGVCVRLYSEHDFLSRSDFEEPEILRLDLARLRLDEWRIAGGEGLRWLDAPPVDKVSAADRLLLGLGAIGSERLTPLGESLASSSLHPRLARALRAGKDLGVGAETAVALAVLSEQAFENNRAFIDVVKSKCEAFRRDRLFGNDQRLMREASFIASQAGLSLQAMHQEFPYDLLAQALFAGFFDLVAKLRQSPPGTPFVDYNLTKGGGARLYLSRGDVAETWILVLDASESLQKSFDAAVRIDAWIGIEEDVLLNDTSGLLRDEFVCRWDAKAERAIAASRSLYGSIVVEERTRNAGHGEEVAEILAQTLFKALQSAWPKPFGEDNELDGLLRRIAFIARSSFADQLGPELREGIKEKILAALCEGRANFAVLDEEALRNAIHAVVSFQSLEKIEALAPSFVMLKAGRKLRINYEPDKSPWVSSRIQDFYGTTVTPSVLKGSEKITMHLLAPNKRPVQVTNSLESFWQNTYKTLVRELSRDYPRHFWPDAPEAATPPPPGRIRR